MLNKNVILEYFRIFRIFCYVARVLNVFQRGECIHDTGFLYYLIINNSLFFGTLLQRNEGSTFKKNEFNGIECIENIYK